MDKGLWLSFVRIGQGDCGEMVMVITGKVRAEELWRKSYGHHW